jgi:O-acetylserine/cysteine efflux transporter
MPHRAMHKRVLVGGIAIMLLSKRSKTSEESASEKKVLPKIA